MLLEAQARRQALRSTGLAGFGAYKGNPACWSRPSPNPIHTQCGLSLAPHSRLFEMHQILLR